MTVSPLADLSRDIPAGNRWNPRESAITGFGIHHNAGVDAYGQATAPDREVSANYWITNDGTIIPNVDEDYRAFTSGMAGYPAGAAADHRNITVEVSNTPEGVANKTWEISDAALEALAKLIADVYRRYGLGPVARGAERGVGIHSDWVPTECPGPYMRDHLGAVIARAEALRTGTTASAPPIHGMETDMLVYYAHAFGKKKPGWLVLGYTPKPLILSTQGSANEWGRRIGKETIETDFGGFKKYLAAAGGTPAQLAAVSAG